MLNVNILLPVSVLICTICCPGVHQLDCGTLCDGNLFIYEIDAEKNEGLTLKNKMNYDSIKLMDLESMLSPNQFFSDETYLESITSLDNFYYVLTLNDGYYLKIYPDLPPDFTYNYLIYDQGDIVEDVRNRRIKCAFLYKNRDLLGSDLHLVKHNDGFYHIIYTLSP